jgi:hypothetical protein
MPLSDTVKELIIKARIVSFDAWSSTHPAEIIALFQNADDRREYLTDAELEQIKNSTPDNSHLIAISQLLRDRTPEIVDEARSQVLSTFPTITQPGGGLYPPERAEACWRDFWHFLRCITYGIAGERVDYTSDRGFYYLDLLYRELHVPLDAMLVGLKSLKAASLERLEPNLTTAIAPYFDRLIENLPKPEVTPDGK